MIVRSDSPRYPTYATIEALHAIGLHHMCDHLAQALLLAMMLCLQSDLWLLISPRSSHGFRVALPLLHLVSHMPSCALDRLLELTQIQRVRHARRKTARTPAEPQGIVDRSMLHVLALLHFCTRR